MKSRPNREARLRRSQTTSGRVELSDSAGTYEDPEKVRERRRRKNKDARKARRKSR